MSGVKLILRVLEHPEIGFRVGVRVHLCFGLIGNLKLEVVYRFIGLLSLVLGGVDSGPFTS